MAQDSKSPGELSRGSGLLERLDEVDQSAVVNATSRLCGGDRQGECQMGFAYAWWSEEDHVLAALDEAQFVQTLDLVTLDRGLEGKVELLESLDGRQPRGSHGGLQPSVVAQRDLRTE